MSPGLKASVSRATRGNRSRVGTEVELSSRQFNQDEKALSGAFFIGGDRVIPDKPTSYWPSALFTWGAREAR
jgi:hypothetical protein